MGMELSGERSPALFYSISVSAPSSEVSDMLFPKSRVPPGHFCQMGTATFGLSTKGPNYASPAGKFGERSKLVIMVGGGHPNPDVFVEQQQEQIHL